MARLIETKAVEIDEYKIVYDQMLGEGSTIVLVHGITTYRFIWRNLFPFFPENCRVVALDLLGCGDSDKPLDVSYSVKAHSARLKKFVDKLGIKKFHLVGHDVGGGVSQIFAVNHHELLVSLTLLNSVAYDFWPVQPISAMRTPIIRQLAVATLDLGMLKVIVNRGLFDHSKLTDDLLEKFSHPLKTKAGRKAFLHFARCLDNNNLLEIEAELTELPVPTLIIRGAADPYLSEKISHRLKAGIPNSMLEILERGSHFIQEDLPLELVKLISERFLSNDVT
ncbi:MAG: alpha/beta hydrolase [Candidatus Marinimicrobia bacterium]|nr:alpha/beta hydrolase [Candidatus Neomarinimicrobiota bacterium]